MSWVEEANAVSRGAPSSSTCAPFTNFEPVTVRLKLPTSMVVGDALWTIGIGFSRETAALAESVLFAELAAVTVTAAGLGSIAGAV